MKHDFDVIVIGGGAAGLVAATGTAGLGARTALVEKNKLGGDCTWYGCIPSKALLRSAQVFSLFKRTDEFGLTGNAQIKTSGVMAHVRDVARQTSLHIPPDLFEKRGISLLTGAAKFMDNHTIELNGLKISAKRFIICTGSQPLVPPIEGLQDINYLTNENIFDLQDLPKSLAVLGGGPIGVELSQAFSKLGVEVSIIEMTDRILFREDTEAAAVLTAALVKDGVKIYAGQKAVKFSTEDQVIAITMENKDKEHSTIKAEKVLVAVGRVPNCAGLDLEKAGVKYSGKGIQVDNTLRTTANNIYASGDVVGPYQFSHMAEYQAIIAVGNALFPFKRKTNYQAVPWCTFTDPELAHAGLTEDEARNRYKNIKVYRSFYRDNDRAITDLEETGFAKVICDRKGYVLGAHIVGANAGEIIHECVLAMSAKLKIGQLSSTLHIYPTLSQVVKRSADQYYTDLLSAGWVKTLSRYLIRAMR
ncbi:MAG: dihydrolipoyl dehydrogenase [bacterium]|nr:dihydrolipoyl dehydrogenase [bacterium]MDD5354773.1 dihydrolipoyl dehydrogenase [bacterium]MDD5757310.1 dihydrolipoyl dehydrogenase [bacterium]